MDLIDAFGKRFPAADDHGHELGGVDDIAGGLGEIAPATEGLLRKRQDIVDLGHGHDSEPAQMGIEDHRLGLIIADDPDPDMTLEFMQLGFELGSKVGILEVMDRSVEHPVMGHGHAAARGT
jgi:hypothetical protein